jgi:hypothetical protein
MTGKPTDRETHTAPDDDLPDPTEAQAEAMAFDAARRRYMKELFLSGEDALPELEDLPVPEELGRASEWNGVLS